MARERSAGARSITSFCFLTLQLASEAGGLGLSIRVIGLQRAAAPVTHGSPRQDWLPRGSAIGQTPRRALIGAGAPRVGQKTAEKPRAGRLRRRERRGAGAGEVRSEACCARLGEAVKTWPGSRVWGLGEAGRWAARHLGGQKCRSERREAWGTWGRVAIWGGSAESY